MGHRQDRGVREGKSLAETAGPTTVWNQFAEQCEWVCGGVSISTLRVKTTGAVFRFNRVFWSTGNFPGRSHCRTHAAFVFRHGPQSYLTHRSGGFCLFSLSRKAYANGTRNSDGRSGCSVCNQTNGSEGIRPYPERSSLVNAVDEERYRFVRLSCAHVSLS
jgi:hypothetical protein